jgi:hypothetical protein
LSAATDECFGPSDAAELTIELATFRSPGTRASNLASRALVGERPKRLCMGEAHGYERDYARAVGMTLGSAISVSDAEANGYFGPGGPGALIGPFGANQHCGTVRQPLGKLVRGKQPTLKKVHRCFVPRFAYTTLTVTYLAG